MVGFGELNGSGHSGVAILVEQGQQTAVTVYLAEGLSGDADAEAAGATASDDTEAAADTAMVDIKDFACSPDQSRSRSTAPSPGPTVTRPRTPRQAPTAAGSSPA